MTTRDDVPDGLIRDFDHNAGSILTSDPFELFETLRGDRPVWSPNHGGYWITTTAEQAKFVLRDPHVFSTRWSSIPTLKLPTNIIPMNAEPAEHTRYRRVMNPPFAPPVVERYRASLERTCHQLIDGFINDGRCEFVWTYGRQVPLHLFVEMMGLPGEDVHKYTEWDWALTHGGEHDRSAVMQTLERFLDELAAEKIKSIDDEGDDVPRGILRRSRDAGEMLTHAEMMSINLNLFLGGLDTVGQVMGFSVRFLALHPEERRRIIDDPSLLPTAIEEFLRYHSIVNSTRTVMEDVELAGVKLRMGDRILVPTTIVSRDASSAEDPQTFDITRDPNRHLAFGSGPHRCAGSHLARLELLVSLRVFLERIPHFRIPEGGEVRFHGGGVMGVDHLPLEWEVA